MVTKNRLAEKAVAAALRIFRIVMIGGPRQAGKTTLARRLGAAGRRPRHFVTLDDLGALSAARVDPQGFLRDLPTPATIDEVQRAPQLLLALKRVVDEQPRAGAYLLTGSADPMAVQSIKDALAGRLGIIQLGPMTLSEQLGRREWNPLLEIARCRSVRDLIGVFSERDPGDLRLDRAVMIGGFPEPALHLRPAQREQWHDQYIKTYLERDVPELVRIDDIAAFLRWVRLAAATTGNLLNLARLARDAGVSNDTARRWLSVLESTYLATTLPPYFRNVRKRLTKTPKLHLADTGLVAALLGLGGLKQADRLGLAGSLVETWVHAQVRSFIAALPRSARLHFFRSHAGDECDLVVEQASRLIPIEVKAGGTLSRSDADGLRVFLDLFSEAPFGIVLYSGQDCVPLGDRTVGIPLGAFLGAARKKPKVRP